VKYEYIVHQPRIYRGPAFCAFAAFQTSGDWSVVKKISTSFCSKHHCLSPSCVRRNSNFHGMCFIQWHMVIVCIWCVLFVASQS